MLTISASPAFYRLASQTIFLNPSIPEMQPFRLDTQIFSEPPLPPNLDELYVSAPSLRAEGWISDRLETITFWRDDQGVLLDIPSAGRFWTSADGAAIRHISGPPELEPSILAQSLLGPPLVLALALNGVWCLHASAIIIEDRAVVSWAIQAPENPPWRPSSGNSRVPSAWEMIFCPSPGKTARSSPCRVFHS